MVDFYNNVWHPYWTILDLALTIFILYQLRKVSKNLNQTEHKDKQN